MSIYKDCDIRGKYPGEINEQEVYAIGRAVGSMHTGKTLAVGGDFRLSTPSLKEQLIRGLLESGVNVKDIGEIPTPVLYFTLHHYNFLDGGIMVTASHNPSIYNGLKFMFGEQPVTPEDVEAIRLCVEKGVFNDGKGTYSHLEAFSHYEAWMGEHCSTGKLKVVVDAGNGAMSRIAPSLFSTLGYSVVPLFCWYDGSFPNRDPNPAVYRQLVALQDAVLKEQAHMGVAFDGDGDRVVFVDDKGRAVTSEVSLSILISSYLKDVPAPVVYDQKCASIVRDTILRLGGAPIMERSGHAFIKHTFLEHKAALGGEISGHFFFRELGYDDGLYAALKMAEIVGAGESLSTHVDAVPTTLITPDIRIPCPYIERDEWLARVKAAAANYPVSTMDGIRVEFDDGWMLIRKSVTEEGITLRIEAKDTTAMERIENFLIGILPQSKPYL